MFKAARLNSDGGFRAAAIPAIIREPELAFDAQQWRDPKRYGMIPHTPFSPQFVSASAIIIFAQTRANERYGGVSPTIPHFDRYFSTDCSGTTFVIGCTCFGWIQ